MQMDWRKRLTALVTAVILAAGIFSAAGVMPAAAEDVGTRGATYSTYSQSKGILMVKTGGVTRKYKMYKMTGCSGSYLKHMGCTQMATAVAASAFLKKPVSPNSIHGGRTKSKCSERYALNKLHYRMRTRQTAGFGKLGMSLKVSAQILQDLGVKCEPVYKFTSKSAEADIRAHLMTGNPVIVKCNNKKYNKVRMANTHHAWVLVGIDKQGYVIAYEVYNGKINWSHSTFKNFKMDLHTLVTHHMTSPTGNINQGYVTSTKMAGGYIKVG